MANIKLITEGVVLKVMDVFGPIIGANEVNKDIIYCPEEIALRKRAEVTIGRNTMVGSKKDKYELEFISIWLTGIGYSWERQRTSVARTGVMSRYVDSTAKTDIISHKLVPIDLEFSIIMWTSYKEKVDRFIAEYCFLQQDNPQVEFFYDGDKKFEIDLLIRPMIRADDTVSKMFIDGKYWRPEIVFRVEGWLIKDLALKTAKTIHIDTYASDSLERGDDNVLVFSKDITES